MISSINNFPSISSLKTLSISNNNLNDLSSFITSAKTKYPTSINRKMKLKWKMPKDSFVYAKWYPVLSDSSYKDTKNWQADLDLEKCGSYLRLKGDS